MNVRLGEILDGKYLLLAEIGKGGMGVVYKAKHIQFDKLVAIKMLPASLVGEKSRLLRFHREARLLASVHHPNIVAAQSFGFLPNGAPYLVMELIEGKSLTEFAWTVSEADRVKVGVNIFRQICGALAYVHEKGIVHRDIKPTNIIITTDESGELQPMLIDFGMGRLQDLDDSKHKLTQTGLLVGSPPYMSPEHWTGSPADHRSDIYALGCVMYEYFTGSKYVTAGTIPEILSAHLTNDPEETLQEFKTFGEMDQIKFVLMRALEKDPVLRYQSAADMNRHLALVESGVVISFQRTAIEPAQKLAKSVKGGPFFGTRMLIAVTVIFTFATAIGMGYWHQQLQNMHNERIALGELFDNLVLKATGFNLKETDDQLRQVKSMCYEFLDRAGKSPADWVRPQQRIFAHVEIATVDRNLGDDAGCISELKKIMPEVDTLPLVERQPEVDQFLEHIDPVTCRLNLAAACLRHKSEYPEAVAACKQAIELSSQRKKLARIIGKVGAERYRDYEEWGQALLVLLYRTTDDESGAQEARAKLVSLLQTDYKVTPEKTSKIAQEMIEACEYKVSEHLNAWWWSH